MADQPHESSLHHPETLFIHAGQQPDPISGAVVTPISLATTFAQKTPGEFVGGYEYSRTGNPTRKAFEECMAASEGAKYGLAFASGSAALWTILGMYQPGDHIICIDDVYGGTQREFLMVSKPCQNIDYSLVDMTDPQNLEREFRPNTKAVWVETPTNPTLKIVDIQALADVAHAHGAILYVDNTFSSPYLQSPLALGADVVTHSVTKYIGGHSDTVMGLVCTSNQGIYEKLKFLQNAIGAVPAPFDCYMALRGMKTLHLRMKAHSENAMKVAEFLEAHPKIDRVVYPGLASHPQYDIAKKQMRMPGGMITMWMKGGLEHARTFLESVKLFICAESLGAVECLLEHPAIMTHASVPAERRAELGISDSMVRLSIGVEHIDDIIQDLQQALDKVNLA